MRISSTFLIVCAALLLLPIAVSSPAFACGPDSDCALGERTYRIRMPQAHDGASKVGAIIFLHGYRGTARGLMRNKRLRKSISDMGLAFVAAKSARADWDIPNAPSEKGEGELAYFDALKTDLVQNHHIAPHKIMVTGFSAGGMMTWELACNRSGQFAAFAPMSGTFWAPVPKRCSSNFGPIIHMHGTADKVVPLKGRKIQQTSQGSVYGALKLVAQSKAHSSWRSMGEFDGLSCQSRRTEIGPSLQFCLHEGGHTFKSSWLGRAWSEFEKMGAFEP